MISEDVIQKIKEENDIVDIVSESVRLKKAGSNYLGVCPFHHEKTPSFSVSPEKQIYKCFGCGEAGNVITFVMKTKRLTFLEALKVLAEKANIQLEDEKGNNNTAGDRIQEKLYTLNTEAAKFYFYNLKKNKTAQEYFIRRGISPKTINKFGLGYALEGWNNLIKFFKNKGYTELDMISAGLVLKSEKGTYYDRFRNRVIFPVFDYRGRVIGFGGRVLDDSKPKYLNSPETMVFKKGINLYGLNFAVKDGIYNKTLIIVEGYMDCIALHQAGITNVVASLGTALTTNQAKLMKRYAEKVIISYDADFAGQTATLRGIDILRKEGLDVRILKVPEGKDPDEYIKNNGKESFMKLIESALPFIDYRIAKLREGINFKDPGEIVKYAESALDILLELDSIERAVHIKRLSESTKIREEALYDILKKKLNKGSENSEQLNINASFGQKFYLDPSYIKAERSLLKLMIENEEAFEYIKQNVHEDFIITEAHKNIYNYIVELRSKKEEDINAKLEVMCNSGVETSSEFINIHETKFIYDEDNLIFLIKDFIKQIRKYKLEESKKEVMDKIKKYEAEGNFRETLVLSKELIKIQKSLSEIN